MIKIVILHFQPLEYYPPIQNIINHFEQEFKLVIITTGNSKNLSEFKSTKSNIFRLITIREKNTKLFRIIKYLYFNILSAFYILFLRPDKIIYFETESSFPCYIIKKYFYKKTPVFIHYHEYLTLTHYQKWMKLNKYFHSKEYFLYKNVNWISHTNKFRLNLFQKDYPFIKTNCLKVLPNRPPGNWKDLIKQRNLEKVLPVKLVYVGSISMRNVYAKEIFDWISSQNGKITLDIYSVFIYEEVHEYLKTLNCEYISYKGSIDYNSIPLIIPNYDVGLILYKGDFENYIYNETNKLTEYLMCGIDVWFSKDLIPIHDFIIVDEYPKVICVDFENLQNFNYSQAIDRNGLQRKSYNFSCEDVLKELKNELYR